MFILQIGLHIYGKAQSEYSHCWVIHSSKRLETIQMSLTGNWINKSWYIHIEEHYVAFEMNDTDLYMY